MCFTNSWTGTTSTQNETSTPVTSNPSSTVNEGSVENSTTTVASEAIASEPAAATEEDNAEHLDGEPAATPFMSFEDWKAKRTSLTEQTHSLGPVTLRIQSGGIGGRSSESKAIWIAGRKAEEMSEFAPVFYDLSDSRRREPHRPASPLASDDDEDDEDDESRHEALSVRGRRLTRAINVGGRRRF